MRLIVTGPTHPIQGADAKILAAMKRVAENNGVEAFGSGCAHGVDTKFALLARAHFKDAEHHLFVPDAPSNLAGILALHSSGWVRHECHAGRTNADSYGIRNEAMCRWIREAGLLLAFPNDGREVMRGSGTWWTVRIANRMQVPVLIEPLDGSPVERHEGVQPARAAWL